MFVIVIVQMQFRSSFFFAGFWFYWNVICFIYFRNLCSKFLFSNISTMSKVSYPRHWSIVMWYVYVQSSNYWYDGMYDSTVYTFDSSWDVRKRCIFKFKHYILLLFSKNENFSFLLMSNILQRKFHILFYSTDNEQFLTITTLVIQTTSVHIYI